MYQSNVAPIKGKGTVLDAVVSIANYLPGEQDSTRVGAAPLKERESSNFAAFHN
jgi:hypothetical protein